MMERNPLRLPLSGDSWIFKGFIGEDWLLRNGHLSNTRDRNGWHPAVVPGSVQNDLWQAGLLPDPYFELNSFAVEWASDRTWVYKRWFQAPSTMAGRRIRLVFRGVDYSAWFYLNDTFLGRHEGMFIPAAFEVADLLNFGGENHLAVVIDPAPHEQPQVGYTSHVRTQKTRMNYWWDFCPRIVHLGVWDEVFLHASGPLRIDDVHVRSELSEDLQSADVRVTISLDGASDGSRRVEVALLRDGEETVLQEAHLEFQGDRPEIAFFVEHPDIWWPNGAGGQPLYQARARVFADGELSDDQVVTFGIRSQSFAQNEGAPQGSLPYNLMVNGRKLYINGWNWVPMDVFYGVERPEKLERLLRLAKRANVNLLRVWGGGLIEKEFFYNLCDRLGILVWQEFIQSSSSIENIPPDDPEFISLLARTAEASVKARRSHPSLAVWCGGNELHYAGDHLCDDSHPALAALRQVVERLDPGRQWYPTSPAGGLFGYKIPASDAEAEKLQDVHGPWEYQGVREQYALYNSGRSLLHSEFGVEGITNMRTLRRTITRERLEPVSLTNPVWHHLGAWWVKERVWQEVFDGPFAGVETAQRMTQFLQADGLRYAVEADRRRMFYNGGTMPWQFNEPYPMAACTSAVDYYAEPKPVYYTVARAYAPVSLTARFDTLAWGGEEAFSAEVWCASTAAISSGKVTARLLSPAGMEFARDEWSGEVLGPGALKLMAIHASLNSIPGDLFFLDLVLAGADGEALAQNRYLFTRSATLAPLAESREEASIRAQVEKEAGGGDWWVALENDSSQAVLWLWMETDKADLRSTGWAFFSDNYFCLLPGERRQVKIAWSMVEESQRNVSVSGWNLPEFRLD